MLKAQQFFITEFYWKMSMEIDVHKALNMSI